MPPLVTIVIPTYNYGCFIADAVRSATAQSYENTEIFVVDDGSTDDTPLQLKRLKAEFPDLRVLTTEHRGVSHARNHGTRAGRGLYVAYLDADDLWHPHKIEKQVAAMAQHADDPEWAAVYCLFRPINDRGFVFGNAPAFETRGYIFARHLGINPIGNGSGMMIRRDVILELGGFDPSYSHCEDLDVQLRVSKRYKIELVREYLVGYRQHRNSASQKHLEMADAVLKVAEKHTCDPAIPEKLRKATFVAAYRYAWYKYVKGGQWRKGFLTFLYCMISDPSAAFDNLMLRAVPNLHRKMRYLGDRLSPGGPSAPLHFFDIESTEGVTLREPAAYTRLSAKFNRFDALMHERFVKAPSNDQVDDKG